VRTVPESDPTPQPGSHQTESQAGCEAFDAGVEEIRRRYGSSEPFLFARLEDLIRRRLGLASRSAGSAVLAGLTGVGIRLGVVLAITALVGQWADIPWGRWTAIIVFYALFDATQPWRTQPIDEPPSPRIRQILEDWTPLLSTMVSESDVRDLADFSRRWDRLPVAAAVGSAVATLMLGTGRLFTPDALSELPAGSLALLAFLLYDFGALMVFGGLFEWAFMTRQATYDHRLFWPSPADSPEVRKAMQMWNVRALTLWITIILVMTLVLVPWGSPLLIPLAAGFIVIGYLVTLGAAFGSRGAIRKIIETSRQQQLSVLRDRIDAFESRFADLSSEESERLRDLLSLHGMIRDAPSAPTHSRNLLRTAAALIPPTIMFAITVFGEVSAERFLDAILP
jgi:hypothetical protein